MRRATWLLAAAMPAGACSSTAAPPTSEPEPPPTTTAATTAAPPPSTTATTAPPSSTTASTAPTPVSLTIDVRHDGFYTEGSLTHLEVFRFFPDSDAYPVPVHVADWLGGPEVLELEVSPGSYEVRSYQRPCPGSCDALEPPADGCAAGLDIAGNMPVVVDLTVRPGRACDVDVSGATTSTPARSMELTLAEPGGPGCDPPSPYGPWSQAGGLTEMLGTGHGDAVMWALWWDRPPLRVRTEIKLVLRLTGAGPFDVVAVHEDGTELEPNWGPNDHGPSSSSYGRPGNEWGMAFFYTKTGCWNLRVTRGAVTVDAWVEVGGRD